MHVVGPWIELLASHHMVLIRFVADRKDVNRKVSAIVMTETFGCGGNVVSVLVAREQPKAPLPSRNASEDVSTSSIIIVVSMPCFRDSVRLSAHRMPPARDTLAERAIQS